MTLEMSKGVRQRASGLPISHKEIAMLVLSRRPGESVVIELPTGEQIEVVVQSIKGNQVRIGINTPPDMVILREEVADRRVTQVEQDAIG